MDNIGSDASGIFIIAIGVLFFKMIFSNWFKTIKSKKIAVNKLIKLKGDMLSGSILQLALLSMNLRFYYSNAKFNYSYGISDIEINSFSDFVLSREPLLKMLYIFTIFLIIILIINIIISLIFKVGIFENGIVVEYEGLIPWNSIKRLESENAMSDKYKVLVIYTDKTEKRKLFKKPHRVKVRSNELEEAVNIIRNKMNLT